MKSMANALLCGLFVLMGAPQEVMGQTLREQLQRLVLEATEVRLADSPDGHGQHFRITDLVAAQAPIAVLSNFITSNIGAFPLASTVAGTTFDFSKGRPVVISSSLGPVFTERATTLGRGRFNLGFSLNLLNMSQIRGNDLEKMRLSFPHQDVGQPGYGDEIDELDTIDMLLGLDMSASILALVGSVGLTDYLDLGIAIPFINISMKAEPSARINSITQLSSGTPNHFFNGDAAPLLETPLTPIDDTATGIGDIALRAKLLFLKSSAIDMAALVEYRPGNANEDNFLGSDGASLKGVYITSATFGSFSPHLNTAYEMRTSDLDRNEVEIFFGFDQKIDQIGGDFTLAVDVLAELEIGDEIETLRLPDPVPVENPPGITLPFNQFTFTNMPNRSNDNIINGSIGIKFSPNSQMSVIANVILPLNDGGLRAKLIPTAGISFNF